MPMPADTVAEYTAATETAALFDRPDRGVLRLTGTDGRKWLHGLITNAVANLPPGAGCYAFATNAQGRILFDLHVAIRPEEALLLLDRNACPAALAHFERYHFTEDVQLTDASAEFTQFTCHGPQAPEIAAALGVADLTDRPFHHAINLPTGGHLFRRPFGEYPVFDALIPAIEAADFRNRIVEAGARPAGPQIWEVLRIAAARPKLGAELDEQTLPAETGVFDEAVGLNKGCYIGHEVIERMRSRDVTARHLVRLQLDNAVDITPPAPILSADREVGRLTSLAQHPLTATWLALGYLSTRLPPGAPLTVGTPPRPIHPKTR